VFPVIDLEALGTTREIIVLLFYRHKIKVFLSPASSSGFSSRQQNNSRLQSEAVSGCRLQRPLASAGCTASRLKDVLLLSLVATGLVMVL